MDYKGYSVEVSGTAESPATDRYRASYVIRRGEGPPVLTGTVAGQFPTSDDAKQRAVEAARRWIDNQPV